MKQVNSFFDFVTNILFEKNKIDIDITSSQIYSPYIVNRYVTFADTKFTHLINNSVNMYGSVFSINIDHYHFLHALIPKTNRKYINYTKKIKKEKIVLFSYSCETASLQTSVLHLQSWLHMQ